MILVKSHLRLMDTKEKYEKEKDEKKKKNGKILKKYVRNYDLILKLHLNG